MEKAKRSISSNFCENFISFLRRIAKEYQKDEFVDFLQNINEYIVIINTVKNRDPMSVIEGFRDNFLRYYSKQIKDKDEKFFLSCYDERMKNRDVKQRVDQFRKVFRSEYTTENKKNMFWDYLNQLIKNVEVYNKIREKKK